MLVVKLKHQENFISRKIKFDDQNLWIKYESDLKFRLSINAAARSKHNSVRTISFALLPQPLKLYLPQNENSFSGEPELIGIPTVHWSSGQSFTGWYLKIGTSVLHFPIFNRNKHRMKTTNDCKILILPVFWVMRVLLVWQFQDCSGCRTLLF